MALQIRPATYDDFAAYAQLITQLTELHIAARPDIFQVSQPSFPIRKFFYDYIESSGKTILLAWEDKTLLGIALLRTEGLGDKIGSVMKPKSVLCFDDIVVDEASRGKKIGNKLMAAASDWGKLQGAEAIHLSVYNFNKNAVKFYEKEGFSTLKLEMEKAI